MKRLKLRKGIFLGVLTALSVALPPIAGAQDVAAARTTIITACGKLFSIDANAANLTPEQRAAIVQKNLDNALVATKHRTPDAVRVGMMNNNPIVTLDGFYIVTADANSAARSGITQLQLAHKWADSIRFCLADAQAVSNYIAMLTGRYPKAKEVATTVRATDVAVMPWGMTLPIKLTTPLAVSEMLIGNAVQAQLTTDVPLAPHFNSYLPAGTLALGNVVDASPFDVNRQGGKDAATISFYALQTPDGKQIPIDGHVLGGLNVWRYTSILPLVPNGCIEPTKATISSSTISFGPGFEKTTTTTTSDRSCCAEAGVITGAWRGLPEDSMTQTAFPRMLLSRNSGLCLPAGTPMTLQLNASSSLAFSSATPAAGIQVSSVGIGM